MSLKLNGPVPKVSSFEDSHLGLSVDKSHTTCELASHCEDEMTRAMVDPWSAKCAIIDLCILFALVAAFFVMFVNSAYSLFDETSPNKKMHRLNF